MMTDEFDTECPHCGLKIGDAIDVSDLKQGDELKCPWCRREVFVFLDNGGTANNDDYYWCFIDEEL